MTEVTVHQLMGAYLLICLSLIPCIIAALTISNYLDEKNL